MSWGWRIIILYAIFIAGTVGWVSYAMTKEVDLVRPDYYEHGLDHDKTMAARARAEALGDNAFIQFDRSSDLLRIQIPTEQAASAAGTIYLYRPNAVDSDRTIALKPAPNGRMTIPAQSLARGVWRFTLDWSVNGFNYELTRTDTI
jgi:hypothetical protein